mgnify:CR=1 FL=1
MHDLALPDGWQPGAQASAIGVEPGAPLVADDGSVVYEFELDDLGVGAAEATWRPENYSGKFFGPTRLRYALTKSRNLVSIRLLQQLGTRQLIEAVDDIVAKHNEASDQDSQIDAGDFKTRLRRELGGVDEETLAEIGKVFNRDHSTVMHAVKVISTLNRRDASVASQLKLLSTKLQQL